MTLSRSGLSLSGTLARTPQRFLTPSGASWSWAETVWTGLPSGTRVRLPEPLFPRIQELTIDEATLVALGVLKYARPHGEGQQEKGLTVSDNQPTRSATPTVAVISIGRAPTNPILSTIRSSYSASTRILQRDSAGGSRVWPGLSSQPTTIHSINCCRP